MRASLGDLFADLRAAADASTSFDQSGNIGTFLSKQLGEFRGLPAASAQIVAQARSVRNVLASGGVTTALDQVDRAETLAVAIQSEWPETNSQVTQLVSVLIPIMPKLSAGIYDGEVLSRLLSSGLDIVTTLHHVNDLIAKRDDARNALQQAIMSPTLSDDQRMQATTALAGTDLGQVLKYVALFGIGYIVFRAVTGSRS